LFFAFVHIPNRILTDYTENMILDSLQIFIDGIIGALIFIRTKNLVFLIGFHALVNSPLVIINSGITIELIILILAIIIVIFWYRINKGLTREDFWSLKL